MRRHCSANERKVMCDDDGHDAWRSDELVATPAVGDVDQLLMAVVRARDCDGAYHSGGLGNHLEYKAGR